MDTLETVYSAPADIDIPRSRALIVAAVGLIGCAAGVLQILAGGPTRRRDRTPEPALAVTH